MFLRNLARSIAAASLVGVVALGGATAAQADPNAPILRRGSSGNGVKCVQFALRNYWQAVSVSVDGAFGAATETALRDVQLNYGLTVDGVVGKNTGTRLYMMLKSLEARGVTQNYNCYWNLPTLT